MEIREKGSDTALGNGKERINYGKHRRLLFERLDKSFCEGLARQDSGEVRDKTLILRGAMENCSVRAHPSTATSATDKDGLPGERALEV